MKQIKTENLHGGQPTRPHWCSRVADWCFAFAQKENTINHCFCLSSVWNIHCLKVQCNDSKRYLLRSEGFSITFILVCLWSLDLWFRSKASWFANVSGEHQSRIITCKPTKVWKRRQNCNLAMEKLFWRFETTWKNGHACYQTRNFKLEEWWWS